MGIVAVHNGYGSKVTVPRGMGMGAELQYQGDGSDSNRKYGSGVTVPSVLDWSYSTRRYGNGVTVSGGMGMELQYKGVFEWSNSTCTWYVTSQYQGMGV